MLSPRQVSWLRRTGVWEPIRWAHREVSPPVCAAVHRGVTSLPPRLVPLQLALKHEHDHRLHFVHPRLVERSLPVGNWRNGRSAAAGEVGLVPELRRWWSHGGAWKSVKRHPTRNLHGHFVLDGPWDLNSRPFTIRPVVCELFVEGRAPEDTTEYRKLRERIDAGDLRYSKGLRSIAELDRYFVELIATYEAIARDGYRTQEDLGLSGGDEIRVCIDRSGRLCVFGGGTHRLSIAVLLGLDQVPVVVKRVHAEWVRWCTERHRGSMPVAIARGLEEISARQPGERAAEVASAAPAAKGAAC